MALKGQVECVCGAAHFPALAWKHVNCVAPESVAVNAVVHAVNTAPIEGPVEVNKPKRGAYPNTDARREYMREKMRARRPKRVAS